MNMNLERMHNSFELKNMLGFARMATVGKKKYLVDHLPDSAQMILWMRRMVAAKIHFRNYR